MSISGPKSGDKITKSSITSMFNSVRSTINDVQVGDLSRGTFGPDHLPSLILASEVTEETIPGKTISGGSSTSFDEYGWTSATGWSDFTSAYQLDNTTSGWTISQDTYLYAFCSVRIDEAVSDSFPDMTAAPPVVSYGAPRDSYNDGAFEDHQQVWFNLYHTFDGSEVHLRSNNRCAIMQMSPTSSRYTHTGTKSTPYEFYPDDKTQEHTVTISYLTRLSPGTLNRVNLMHALNKGGGKVDFDTVRVKHGTMGMFLIPVI